MTRKQDTKAIEGTQGRKASTFDCDQSLNLGEFSQQALLKLALNEYFKAHPAEDEAGAFAAYLIRHLRLTQSPKSVKAHIAKVIAGQTSMELDYWILLQDFLGSDLFDRYLRHRRRFLSESIIRRTL